MIDEFLEGLEGAHATFAPSYSATWLFCAGSLIPSLESPDIAGIDAAIGTVFHKVMARWLEAEKRPDELYGTVHKIKEWDITVDQEMFNYGQECLTFFEKFEGDYYVETRVDISDLTPIPNQHGTADVAFCQPKILDIIDWKYGTGVQVFAKANTQLLLYAWGFFRKYDPQYQFETINLWIAQPRLDHWDRWTITRSDLQAFAAYARERAAAAWMPHAPRTPSPKACQWCRVQRCAALEVMRTRLAQETFAEFATDDDMRANVNGEGRDDDGLNGSGTVPPPELSTAHLARVYALRKTYERWFTQIGDELVRRAMSGEDTPGWKVVEGRTHRRWRDEDETVEAFEALGVERDQLYKDVMLSPNQSLALLQEAGLKPKVRKEWLSLWAVKPPGRMTLASIDDNREEQPIANAEDMFPEDVSDPLDGL